MGTASELRWKMNKASDGTGEKHIPYITVQGLGAR